MFPQRTRRTSPNAPRRWNTMDLTRARNRQHHLALAFFVAIVCLQLAAVCYAQNLGSSPATGQAVQGQTAAQPEGAMLNLVNWVGNVISPVGAALAVVMAVVSYSQGRGVMRWAVTAGGLLVNTLVRQIEALAGPLGRRLYRGLLKACARVWNPSEIRDRDVLRKVLAQMQSAERGLRRLEAALDHVGPEALVPILR